MSTTFEPGDRVHRGKYDSYMAGHVIGLDDPRQHISREDWKHNRALGLVPVLWDAVDWERGDHFSWCDPLILRNMSRSRADT